MLARQEANGARVGRERRVYKSAHMAIIVGDSRRNLCLAPRFALQPRLSCARREIVMAVNKPVGDNARKGAVRKRSQRKTTLGGASAWTKRNKTSGEFMAVKKPTARKKAAKKFKGIRRER